MAVFKKISLSLTFLVGASLAGCSTMSTNQAMVPLQTATAQMLGLASSDEIVINNVKASEADMVGTQNFSYTAKTTKGRIFNCTAKMVPGLLTKPATLSVPSCTAVLAHSNK